ncbi:hypothetical protein FISHEDRAFT_71257 [Fistulina hepatica ATCC 64428]|nr:hypothetical protein FISHEDRAFT_71257 [Fistulina hepatica ATCC 64428]
MASQFHASDHVHELLRRSDYAPGSYWFYAPNKGAPIAFALFFTISGVCHAIQCTRYKSWKVAGLLPYAAVLFTAGYITREIGAYHYTSLGIYIASTVLLLIAPPVYEGANYFLLGRILYYVPYNAPLHPGRVVSTFIGLDAVTAALTGAGAGRVANSSLSQRQINLGKHLIEAALILQICAMALYISVAAHFHHNCIKDGSINRNLRMVLRTLYTSCTLISIRTIYRTVEYFSAASINVYDITNINQISPVLRHEWFFWVFEATVMLLNSTLLNVFNPSRYLPRNNKIYLARDGVTEIEGPGYKDDRPFLLTVVDPFDVVGIITGRHSHKDQFWDLPTALSELPATTSDKPAAITPEKLATSQGSQHTVSA